MRSQPVALSYDTATASNHGETAATGFDGKGDALPAETLPSDVVFNDVQFHLAPARTGVPNAIAARGQTINLPAGHYNRVYVLAASADGDQKATFAVGNSKTELNVQDWSGFVGQWDDREWSSNDFAHGNYGEMTGLKPGFIKRADLAWYSNHHRDAAGQNVAYAYSYLFGYAIDLPPGAKTLTLPDNDKIRVLAISVADENPEVKPAQPLYDVLPSPHPGSSDLTLSPSSAGLSIPQERSATTINSVP